MKKKSDHDHDHDPVDELPDQLVEHARDIQDIFNEDRHVEVTILITTGDRKWGMIATTDPFRTINDNNWPEKGLGTEAERLLSLYYSDTRHNGCPADQHFWVYYKNSWCQPPRFEGLHGFGQKGLSTEQLIRLNNASLKAHAERYGEDGI